MVARGEVWWYDHPRRLRRPYLILTRTEAVGVLNQLLAVPTTRTIRGIPTEVPLGTDDGMPWPCVLALDNLSLVRPALCTDLITRLGPDKTREVCIALNRAVACGVA